MGHHLPLNCLNCLPEFPEMLAGVEPEHEPYLNLTSVWAPVLRESIMEFREKFPGFFFFFKMYIHEKDTSVDSMGKSTHGFGLSLLVYLLCNFEDVNVSEHQFLHL